MPETTITPTTEEHRDQPGEGNGPEATVAEDRDSVRLLRFSDWVDVGDGAAECEQSRDGSCQNPEHFHAFVRMPNPLQRESLVEKGDAAKARKLRVLRDPESDASTILDTELEEMERHGDHQSLVDEVVGFDFVKDHMAAMREVMEDEEFATIEDDRERLRALAAMPEDERPDEEYMELEKHVVAYTEKVTEEREKIQAPLREATQDRGIEDLMELIRENRVEGIAREAGERAWSEWLWMICTLRTKVPAKVEAKQERVFKDIDALRAAPQEVIEALEAAFRDIEAEAGRSLQEAARR